MRDKSNQQYSILFKTAKHRTDNSVANTGFDIRVVTSVAGHVLRTTSSLYWRVYMNTLAQHKAMMDTVSKAENVLSKVSLLATRSSYYRIVAVVRQWAQDNVHNKIPLQWSTEIYMLWRQYSIRLYKERA